MALRQSNTTNRKKKKEQNNGKTTTTCPVAYILLALMLLPAVWNIHKSTGGDTSWSIGVSDASNSTYEAFFAPKQRGQTANVEQNHVHTATAELTIPGFINNNPTPAATIETTTTSLSAISNTRKSQVHEALHISRDRLKTRVPKWAMDFFDWQTQQLQGLNSSNWKDHRFLIMRCSYMDPACGGLTDRLKPIPLMIRVAHESKRIFMIRWQVPFPLEEFFLPTPHINWTCPSYMLEFLSQSRRKLKAQTQLYDIGRRRKTENLLKDCTNMNTTIIEVKRQLHDGGNYYYKVFFPNATESYWEMTHGIFRGMFQPSPPVDAMVRQQFDNFGLIPGNYTVAHNRNYYKIQMQNVSQYEVQDRSINAVNCASSIRPGAPIYFASDSTYALHVVKEYAASHNYTSVYTSLDVQNNSTTNATSREPLHLDFASRGNQTWPPSAFYDSFVDLLLLGNARCVAYGTGGYGAYAHMLSFEPKCKYETSPGSRRYMAKCKTFHTGSK